MLNEKTDNSGHIQDCCQKTESTTMVSAIENADIKPPANLILMKFIRKDGGRSTRMVEKNIQRKSRKHSNLKMMVAMANIAVYSVTLFSKNAENAMLVKIQ